MTPKDLWELTNQLAEDLLSLSAAERQETLSKLRLEYPGLFLFVERRLQDDADLNASGEI